MTDQIRGANRVTRVSMARRSSGGVCEVRNIAQTHQSTCAASARNWRGGGRQYVDRLSESHLEPLFDLDSKTLFLVDDHQPQVMELARPAAPRRWVPITTSSEPSAKPLEQFVLIAPSAYANRERRGDFERERRHPIAERAVVLLGQHRRRDEHGHLVAGCRSP